MGTPGETSSEERSRSSLSNVLQPFCAPRAAQVDNRVLDRSKNFWAFRELAQFAYPRWNQVKADVVALQEKLEDDAAAALAAGEGPGTTGVDQWHALYAKLLIRDSDGWSYDAAGEVANRVGYPAEWLEEVGYDHGTTYACKTTCP